MGGGGGGGGGGRGELQRGKGSNMGRELCVQFTLDTESPPDTNLLIRDGRVIKLLLFQCPLYQG